MLRPNRRRAPIAVALSLTLLCAIAAAPAAAADDPPSQPPPLAPATRGTLAPEGFADPDLIGTRLLGIASAAGARAEVVQIGASREGRPLLLLSIGPVDRAAKVPEILVIGGMDAVQLASPDQVLATAEALQRLAASTDPANTNAGLLDRVRFHLVALANPDARAAAIARKVPVATNAREVDDDRDAERNENGPSDLDGDGRITTIRRPAPPGRPASVLADSVDPRIVRAANGDKGERATHEIFTEGLDSDGDGRIAEDGPGGVDLDRNFPHRWPEFAPEAGPMPLSEPETMALARFVRDHPAITVAVVFGRHDTLAAFPDTKDKDSTGRTPLVYLAEDHGLYRDFAKVWKDSTKIERSNSADLAGSFVLWLANHRGIAAVAANGFARPSLPPPPEGTPPPPETGDGEQAAWLAVSDTLAEGRGFAPWRAFSHPTLGEVEIGGFAPFFRESPTASETTALAGASANFVVALAEKQPKLEVSDPQVTRLASGLTRITLRVTNTGTLPTVTEMGRVTGVVPPIVVRLALAPDAVLDGRPVEKIDRLAPGRSRDFDWTVRSDGPVDISVTAPFEGPITRRTAVPEAAR